MIPKKLHFIWFGDAPLSDDYLAHITQWMYFNPDYSANIWVSSDDNAADITARMQPHLSPDSPPVFVKNINERRLVFRNIDILLEQIEIGATLAAVDTTKIELMVHEGGVCPDLGLSPFVSLAGHIRPTDQSRCEFSPPGKTSPTTWGAYHFHASEQHGAIYTRAQRILQDAYYETKTLSPDTFNHAFTSSNPYVNYYATIALTGTAVFVAIDCIHQERGSLSPPLISPIVVTDFSEHKPTQKRLDTGDDLDVLITLETLLSTIYQTMRLTATTASQTAEHAVIPSHHATRIAMAAPEVESPELLNETLLDEAFTAAKIYEPTSIVREGKLAAALMATVAILIIQSGTDAGQTMIGLAIYTAIMTASTLASFSNDPALIEVDEQPAQALIENDPALVEADKEQQITPWGDLRRMFDQAQQPRPSMPSVALFYSARAAEAIRLYEHRHDDAQAQNELDKRFGLVKLN